jgi:hypothetical protein
MRISMIILMLAGTGAAADTEIHRCLLEDGTFAFQEMPCPAAPENTDDGIEADKSQKDGGRHEVNDDVVDFVNPFDEPASRPMNSEATLPEPVSPDRAECQKKTRDAIDAIDVEMRESAYTKEQGRAYLADLLVLTQQLRACKQL